MKDFKFNLGDSAFFFVNSEFEGIVSAEVIRRNYEDGGIRPKYTYRTKYDNEVRDESEIRRSELGVAVSMLSKYYERTIEEPEDYLFSGHENDEKAFFAASVYFAALRLRHLVAEDTQKKYLRTKGLEARSFYWFARIAELSDSEFKISYTDEGEVFVYLNSDRTGKALIPLFYGENDRETTKFDRFEVLIELLEEDKAQDFFRTYGKNFLRIEGEVEGAKAESEEEIERRIREDVESVTGYMEEAKLLSNMFEGSAAYLVAEIIETKPFEAESFFLAVSGRSFAKLEAYYIVPEDDASERVAAVGFVAQIEDTSFEVELSIDGKTGFRKKSEILNALKSDSARKFFEEKFEDLPENFFPQVDISEKDEEPNFNEQNFGTL